MKKISIKIKICVVMCLIGIIMVLFCWSNVSALKLIVKYTDDIGTTYDATVEAFEMRAQDTVEDEKETMRSLMSQTKARVSGTLAFDVVLLVLSVLMIALTILIFNKSIVNAAIGANRQLEDISKKLETNKGDLTQRIQIKSNDEIGQLAAGINVFMNLLQG